METVKVIKCNGFVDLIESTSNFSNNDFTELLKGYDNGILLISDIKLGYFEGQYGEGGREEFPPCSFVKYYSVKKLCDINDYITNAEKKAIEKEMLIKKMKELQNYVASFSNYKSRYILSKIWGCDLALRSLEGITFKNYKTIKRFRDSSLTFENINSIHEWVTNYFSKNTKLV